MTLTTSDRPGKLSKAVTVFTNDPKNRQLNVGVSTDVTVLLMLQPRVISFGQLQKAATDSKYISVAGQAKDSITVTSLKPKNEHILAEYNAEGFNGDPEQKIKVTILPTMPVGRFSDYIELNTDSEQVQRLRLNVYGEILGNITFFPRSLNFTVSADKRAIKRAILLKSLTTATFNVTDVKIDQDVLTSDLVTVRDGREYQVQIGIKEGFSRNYYRGRISIRTDDPDQPELHLGVTVRSLQKRLTSQRPAQPLGKETDKKTTDK